VPCSPSWCGLPEPPLAKIPQKRRSSPTILPSMGQAVSWLANTPVARTCGLNLRFVIVIELGRQQSSFLMTLGMCRIP
jgi:hypothetical protein